MEADETAVKLYDTETGKTYTATALSLPHASGPPLRASVSDTGTIGLACQNTCAKLELPRSPDQRILIAHGEERGVRFPALYRPSPSGDLFVKQVLDENGRKQLLVTRTDGKALALDWLGNGCVLTIAQSPLRELVAIMYSDNTLAIYSLTGKPGTMAHFRDGAVSTTLPKAAVIFAERLGGEYSTADIAFGNRPDELRVITTGAGMVTHTHTIKLLSSGEKKA